MPDGEPAADLLGLVRAIGTAPDARTLLDAALPLLRAHFGVRGLEVTFGSPPPSAVPIRDGEAVLGHLLARGAAPGVEKRIAGILAAGLSRLRREANLKAKLRAAEAESRWSRFAGEEKSRLLAAVAHECRTPLTSIRTSTELLLTEPGESEASRRELLETIHEESIRLTRLVNGLLDAGRMHAGRTEWSFDLHPLGPAVLHALRSVSALAAEKEILLEVTGDEGLPPVPMDRDRIIQVLVNLLANAIRHSPAGEVVEVRLAGAPGGVQVRVRDRGPGIPPECRGRVFDRYWQGEKDREGAGLGLAISREIIAAHGGEIWVDEAPGGGCDLVFTIRPSPGLRASAD